MFVYEIDKDEFYCSEKKKNRRQKQKVFEVMTLALIMPTLV